MRPIHNVQRPSSARGRRLESVRLWLFACALLLPAWTQAQTSAPATARELASAFRNVARQATPAVVFITVDKTVAAQGPAGNPFDRFGEDFLRRFFGHRSPGGRSHSPANFGSREQVRASSSPRMA